MTPMCMTSAVAMSSSGKARMIAGVLVLV
jgi:hypothetical protein